jgi:hypothetical protein
MTGPAFGQVAFTLYAAKIFPYDVIAGTWGTGVDLEYVNVLEINPEADEDEIMDKGMTAEKLSVVTKATGKMTFAALNYNAYSGLYNITPASSGATNKSVSHNAGGRGNPYFAIIGKLFGLGLSDMHIGFAKCQMKSHPKIKVEQNKFILPEVEMTMIAPDTSTGKYYKQNTYTTDTVLASNFSTFWTTA